MDRCTVIWVNLLCYNMSEYGAEFQEEIKAHQVSAQPHAFSYHLENVCNQFIYPMERTGCGYVALLLLPFLPHTKQSIDRWAQQALGD